ncbi:MAG: ATP-binding cassette domain-containing protein [Synechococcus sp. MED-G135]|nr:MAG: ATP-binding cassette domain-containing protein [Synechococcus sp. MED-G135]
MTVMLELRDVCLTSSDSPRLNHVSLTFRAGETIALIGPSGAGKSTLLSIANGSLKPSSGTVLWQGTPVHQLPRRQRRRIGTLWQDLHLVEELSVAQNINCGALGRRSLLWALANLLVPLERDACMTCLKQAGLQQDLIDRSVTTLSGGQRQRVALARLFRQRPDLVLADEPLSNLDPALVQDLLNTLLRQTPTSAGDILASTTVVCLHRPDLIDRFDRVIALRDGHVVMDAPSASITTKDLDVLYRASSEGRRAAPKP